MLWHAYRYRFAMLCHSVALTAAGGANTGVIESIDLVVCWCLVPRKLYLRLANASVIRQEDSGVASGMQPLLGRCEGLNGVLDIHSHSCRYRARCLWIKSPGAWARLVRAPKTFAHVGQYGRRNHHVDVVAVVTELLSGVRCALHFRHVAIGASVLGGSGSQR